MSLSVQNPYSHKAEVMIMNQQGTVDTVHVQPFATVKLGAGVSVHPNSMVKYPKLRIIDSLAAKA
jgi:hypothetical protein